MLFRSYLWDPEAPRAAMRVAIETARNAGRKVAFTLSDGFCVDRHRNDFRTLIESGAIDILFANEDEACSLTKTDSSTEERRVGNGCVRPRRSRWSQDD